MARRGGKKSRAAGALARRALRRALALLALALLVGPPVVVGALRFVNPPTSSFIVRDDARGRGARVWTPLSRIAPALQVAVIASEDQKFPDHRGFDLAQIERALLEEGAARGASTITQQVAKNLFLWPGRSFVRKGMEAWITVWIEALWPKRRILEVYLNVAEFGPGVFGAGAAARHFFGVEASQLTGREAAQLAAVLPSPKRMRAHPPSRYVAQRAGEIERAAQQLGGEALLRRL